MLNKNFTGFLILSSQIFSGQTASQFIYGHSKSVENENREFVCVVSTNEQWDAEHVFYGESKLSGVDDQFASDIDLGKTGSIKVAAGGHLTLEDVSISGLRGDNFKCEDETASITFKNCRLSINRAYRFSSGSFTVDGKLSICGKGTFSYESKIISEILDNSVLEVEENGCLRFSSKYSKSPNFIKFNKMSVLSLSGACLCVDAQKTKIEHGKIRLKKKCVFQTSNDGKIIIGKDCSIDELVRWGFLNVDGDVSFES